jgi:hypothetical protein
MKHQLALVVVNPTTKGTKTLTLPFEMLKHEIQ